MKTRDGPGRDWTVVLRRQPARIAERGPVPDGGRYQEQRTISAALFESPPAEGVRSLEVRWIFPGQLATAVAAWFGRFPAETESREDTYLLDPDLRGRSVKVRAYGALEVKAYHGCPGTLDVAGRARGRMESWQKWSIPFDFFRQENKDPPGWRTVAKRRQVCRFSLHGEGIVAGAGLLAGEPGCAVELTEIHTQGEAWWSLGFEATGPAGSIRNVLELTAALVFTQALPGGVEPGTDDSRSYAEWLRRRPRPRRDADA
jgi:hypothetical protein